MPKPTQAEISRLTRVLVDQGKIVQAGWISLKLTTIPESASSQQLDEMRNAFFAGAQHVFGSMMSILDPGAEPTAADLQRMTSIHNELEQFIEDFKRAKGLSGLGSQA